MRPLMSLWYCTSLEQHIQRLSSGWTVIVSPPTLLRPLSSFFLQVCQFFLHNHMVPPLLHTVGFETGYILIYVRVVLDLVSYLRVTPPCDVCDPSPR